MVREYFLPRPQWQPDRSTTSDQGLETASSVGHLGRYYHQEQPSDTSSRPVSIEKALREQCRIPAKQYFVSAILDNGETVLFASPTELKDKIHAFFDMQEWTRCALGRELPAGNTEDQDLDHEDSYFPAPRLRNSQAQSQNFGIRGSNRGPGQKTHEYDAHHGYDRRRLQGSDDFDEESYRQRKRVKGPSSRRTASIVEDKTIRPTQPAKIPIRISDQQAIWNIYDQRFRSLQQSACKLVAKAWVKLVEPKKQSTHPYTGSDEKAPDWWPKPWGPTREERVRHKEPDHLYKKERVHLLKHILRMVVKPNSEQHVDIQKLNLTVAKLEEATNEVLSSFFSDKDSPNNAKKRPYLKEIFLLAKNEERFRNGEIDGTTCVYIMSEDKIPDNYQSDDEGSPIKEDEDEQDVLRGPSILSPRRPAAQILMAHGRTTTSSETPTMAPSSVHGGDHNPGSGGLTPTTTSTTHSYLSELPHRNHPAFPPPALMHHEIGSEHHTAYVDGGSGIGVGHSQNPMADSHSGVAMQQIVPSPHETSRRSSMYNPTADFSAAPASSSMYPAWQQGSTASWQQAQAQAQVQAQSPHGSFVSQSQGYMGHTFEPLPRGSYDTVHDNMFRAGNAPGPSGAGSQSGYSMQMPQHDGRPLPPHGSKVEGPGRGQLR